MPDLTRRRAQKRDYEGLVAEETLILEVTERIASMMDSRKVGYSELAERVGCKVSWLQSVLAGEVRKTPLGGRRSPTLREVAEIAWALDFAFRVEVSGKIAVRPTLHPTDR